MAERGPLAQRLHRGARLLTSAAGQATAGLRMQPSFLIVGAQRCGTTSMYRTLSGHPDVLGAGIHKGVHYFDTAYHRGPRWYRGHFPLSFLANRRRDSDTRPAITGEASPYYMFHPLAPERIARDFPDMRLIVMLRDPVERAYSAFTHESARGFETEPFERALELEESRLRGQVDKMRQDSTYYSLAHQHNAYLARGRYIDQLEEMEKHFPRSRIHLIDSDELFRDAEPVMNELLSFLELAPWSPGHLQQRNARPRRALEGEVRQRLEDHFRPYDERLAHWWGRKPSWRIG